MAHKGSQGVECSSKAVWDLPVKGCRFIGLGIIEVLPDDILVQIMCCLPWQSVMTCKLVCKRWRFLILTPGFISCFLAQQIKRGYGQQDKYLILKAYGRYLFLTSQVPSSDISFSFLQSRESSSNRKCKVKILASSDDLFLCSPIPSTTAYFICNPFTREWLELPPPPPTSCCGGPGYVFGFTHKPYYCVEESPDRSEQRVVVNSCCRYSVVRLKIPVRKASEFEIDIFSSETWQWTTFMMQHSSCPSRPSSCISRNGLLYWLCNSTGRLIIHDPYNNKVCYVVEEPLGIPSKYNFSVSQGSLMLFDLYPSFKVWELEENEDHHPPEWRFVASSLELEEYEEKSSEILEWLAEPMSTFVVIAVHPNDRNIFYLWTQYGGVGTLNLRTGQFKRRFVPKLIKTVDYIDHGVRRFIKIAPYEMVVFKAPSWPTPISALRNQAC